MMWVNLLGFALIGLIVWWFWLSRPRAAHAGSAPLTVTVADGVYTPAHIEVRAGEPLVLRFVRNDPSPCAEKVVFAALNVSAELPVGKPHDVRLPPLAPGEYIFTCEMQMYRGSIMVI